VIDKIDHRTVCSKIKEITVNEQPTLYVLMLLAKFVRKLFIPLNNLKMESYFMNRGSGDESTSAGKIN
jgi:hypothetical protein